ncbi:MAG: hypothetical protein HQK54_16335 [Oligoflexales bacterium]|nr:hypothetical protein [Oligoflexales bacterium]
MQGRSKSSIFSVLKNTLFKTMIRTGASTFLFQGFHGTFMKKGGAIVGHRWQASTKFNKIMLSAEILICPICGKKLKICDHRHHKIYTLNGPQHLVCQLTCCVNPDCPKQWETYSPSAEMQITMPFWLIGWDVFSFIGHRRFSRHWSVSQIQKELEETYQVFVSHDCIQNQCQLYQTMIAARQNDFEKQRVEYQDVKGLILSIDGLQPEKGHETLYVVREVGKKRVWFAESLVSSSFSEVEKLFLRAKEWAERLNIPVKLWISDKQEAFVSGIRTVFSGVPHRYCDNHFLRDVAKPVLEADSSAKVDMRKKIRGLREVEKEMQKSIDAKVKKGASEQELRESTVLDYCSALRGILSDDQGGPLNPPGLRMAEGVKEVRESLEECIQMKTGGEAEQGVKKLAGIIDKGLNAVALKQEEIRKQVEDVRKVEKCLDPETGDQQQRSCEFDKLRESFEMSGDATRLYMAEVMKRFAPGLYIGGDDPTLPRDNLDLERFFKTAKGHERRIHGRRHTGIRLVVEGPTLIPTLDAHVLHPQPFSVSDLLPYSSAEMPKTQAAALRRKKNAKSSIKKEKGEIAFVSEGQL